VAESISRGVPIALAISLSHFLFKEIKVLQEKQLFLAAKANSLRVGVAKILMPAGKIHHGHEASG